jgi:hypothetical protein
MTAPNPKTRRLKIEEEGDPWKGRVRPKIRLVGCWLEQAGFKHGNHVSVKCVAAGVIELRSNDAALMLNDKAS